MPDWVTLAALGMSGVSALFAGLAYLRAGRRLDVEDAKKLEKRLSAIEGTIGALPSQDQLGRLALQEVTLSGRIETLAMKIEAWRTVGDEQIAGVRAVIDRLEHTVDRMEDLHLREGGRR